MLDENISCEIIGSQIEIIKLAYIAFVLLGKNFLAQLVAIFQGGLDENLIKLAAGDSIVDHLQKTYLVEIVFMTDNVRERITEARLKDKHDRN
jgi:hypothetical protein